MYIYIKVIYSSVASVYSIKKQVLGSNLTDRYVHTVWSKCNLLEVTRYNKISFADDFKWTRKEPHCFR